ncbi:hypothetical protein Ocin01_12247, partial [Orchesella cincta]
NLCELQNFTIRVQALPTHFSVLQGGSDLQPYFFGSITFTTRSGTGSSKPLEWKADLVGIKGERKLVLMLHLLTVVPVKKWNYFYNLSSTLQRYPFGIPSIKTIRFEVDKLETFRLPQPVFEWDYAALGHITHYFLGESGLFDLNVAMKVTKMNLPLLTPYLARGPLNHEEYFVGDTAHSDAYDGPFLLELHTADGIIKAHKHVVAGRQIFMSYILSFKFKIWHNVLFITAQSPYIKNMIDRAPILEDQVCKLPFPTVTTKVMKQVMMFIYFGRFDKGWESVYGEIIEISSTLGLMKLLQIFGAGPIMDDEPQVETI